MEEQRPYDEENDKGQSRLKSNVKREIGPDSDIRTGVHFTPLVEPLRTLCFDRKIAPEKVIFILIMSGNSPEFHVKRAYLAKRFCEKTIKKYQRELVEDNVLRTEDVRLKNGRKGKAYHVNSARLWTLREAETKEETEARLNKSKRPTGSSPAGSSPAGSSPAGSSPAGSSPELNQTNYNQTNSNEKNPNHPSGGVTPKVSENARAGAIGAPNHPSALVQFARDNFDTLFAREGRTRDESLGFDFSAANQVVADLVHQLGFERAEAFSRYARAYKTVTRRVQIKPSEIPALVRRFLSEPVHDSGAPSGAPSGTPDTGGESAFG